MPKHTLRRSGRPKVVRSLQPWNKDASVDGFEDLSEDSKEYLPSSHAETARRQKRDANGKFIKKLDGKHSRAAHIVEYLHVQSGGAVSEAPSVSASSGRSKRSRHQPTKAESPTTVTSLNSSFNKNSASPPTDSGSSVEEPLRSPRQSNGFVHSQHLALSVPAPSSIHPSLRYKSLMPTPTPTLMEPPKKEKPTATKPVTPKTTAVSVSSKTDNITTPSSGLKIRLPRMGAIVSSPVKAETHAEHEELLSSRPKAQSSSNRPRRSLRRQPSVTTSATGNSTSTPPSPKITPNGTA